MTAPLLDRRLLDRRPWHEGETAARIEAGAPDIAPVIRTFLTDQHRDFFARVPLVFVAGLDAAGAPAASMLAARPDSCPARSPAGWKSRRASPPAKCSWRKAAHPSA